MMIVNRLQLEHPAVPIGVRRVILLLAVLFCGFDTVGSAPAAAELLLNGDGTWEDGWGWPGYLSPPEDYGAFAECYSGEHEVLAIRLSISGDGFQDPPFADVFVWDDDGNGFPGQVRCVTANVYPPPPGYPLWSNYEVPVGPGCCTSGDWWVGFRGVWVGGQIGFYIGADLNGPNQGCPLTKVAPGQGLPEGWQDVAVQWAPTKALGIGAIVGPCAPVSVERRSWGAVKALYW